MQKHLAELIAVYRDGLLEDTLPFWTRHCVDREHGGFLFCLDRDGSVVDTDKGVWTHGRFIWLLSTLYNTVEPRDEWLELARHGVEFLRKHCFDTDGRMFFTVTREGAPLRKRRYVFTEAFAAIGLAAYARASGEEQAADEARSLFRLMLRYGTTPGLIQPKVDQGTRPSKGIGFPMITLGTAQVLRSELQDPLADEWIDKAIDEIRCDFVKPELQVVMESVGPGGELIDHFDGRTLNPGHALEAAWFILAEAWHRAGDPKLTTADIARQVLAYKLIERFVVIERGDHIVAKRPGVINDDISFKAIAFAKADDIQPMTPPLFTVPRRSQETIE